jgi:hypothetical protein
MSKPKEQRRVLEEAPPRTISSGHAIYLASLAAAYRLQIHRRQRRSQKMMAAFAVAPGYEKATVHILDKFPSHSTTPRRRFDPHKLF